MNTFKKLMACAILFSFIHVEGYSQNLLIRNVTIVDVKNGKLVAAQDVTVNSGRIISVQKTSQKNKAETIIDGKGKYLMPGLWDMHVHFGGGDTLIQENRDLLSLYVLYGITTVRDAAADLSQNVLQWKKEIAEGKLEGPTIFTSGPKIEGYKSIWVGDIEIDNREELNRALDSLQKLKVDFIKITDNTLKPELYLQALTESGKRGWKTSGHVPGALSLQQVSNAGLSSVEHISYMLKAGSVNDEAYARQIAEGKMTVKEMNISIMDHFDTVHAIEVFRLLAKNETAVVPTLSIIGTTAYLDRDDHKSDSMLLYIGPGLRNTYAWRVERAAKEAPEAVEYRHRVFERAAGLLPIIQKSGMKIIAGTDAGYLNCFVYPGLGLHKELEAMVKYGLTPLEALRASIINGPAFLGRSADYGEIKAGKKADLLLLDGNPLIDIANTQKIRAVILKGNYKDKAELNKLRTSIKARASGVN